MVFNPSDPILDPALFTKENWSNTQFGYSNIEEVPNDMPETRGFGFFIRAYVDDDHAGDCITRRSRTEFIIFLNYAPIYWLSK